MARPFQAAIKASPRASLTVGWGWIAWISSSAVPSGGHGRRDLTDHVGDVLTIEVSAQDFAGVRRHDHLEQAVRVPRDQDLPLAAMLNRPIFSPSPYFSLAWASVRPMQAISGSR